MPLFPSASRVSVHFDLRKLALSLVAVVGELSTRLRRSCGHEKEKREKETMFLICSSSILWCWIVAVWQGLYMNMCLYSIPENALVRHGPCGLHWNSSWSICHVNACLLRGHFGSLQKLILYSCCQN